MQKKGKQARGRAVPARRLPRNRHLRCGPTGRAGSEVRGPAAAPARPGAPLTREAATPLAVPAAPLQDEVAAALLSHPQLQGVLQQHLLGLEPHRSGPAAPAGPGLHRPGRRPLRAEPARKEAAARTAASRCRRSERPGSAAGAARPAQSARRPRPQTRPSPAHGRPGPAHIHPHPTRLLPGRLPGFRVRAAPAHSSGVGRGSPIPAARYPLLPAALAGGAATLVPSPRLLGGSSGWHLILNRSGVREKYLSCSHSCRLPDLGHLSLGRQNARQKTQMCVE